MEFYELLNEFMDRHSVRAVDLCTKLDLKKAYFSRIRNGTLLPSDYQLVYDLAKLMQLTAEESKALTLAYQASKTNTKCGLAYKAFNKLYEIEMPVERGRSDVCHNTSLSNGRLLSGSDEVINAAVGVMLSAKEKICLFLKPEHDELMNALSETALNTAALKWLMPMEQGTKSSEHNMDSFVNAIPVLLSGRTDLRGHYVHLEEYFSSLAFPYYIVNESELLLFSRDLNNGLYLNEADTVGYYIRAFDENFENGIQFMKLYNELDTFFAEYDSIMDFRSNSSQIDIYVVEKNPCISQEVGTDDIQAHIAEEHRSQQTANAYIQLLRRGYSDITTIYSIFTEDGLQEYLDSEEYYEIGSHLSEPLTKDFRLDALNKMMSYSAVSDNYVPMIVRLPIFDKTNLDLINMWSDGKMIGLFNFKDSFSILLLNEASIVSSFLDYYRMLIKCGLVRTKEDTLELMQKRIDERNDDKSG